MELLIAGAAALGIELTPVQVARFQQYYTELVEWNRRANLTAVTGLAEVQERHFLDSLTACLVIPAESLRSGRFLDVGAGAGFPGMPLKIAFPGIRLTLVESTAKKTAFLSHLKEVLEYPDVEVRTGRAEELAHDPALRESFDVVLSRAVARLNVLAELALPFCRTGGIFVAHKAASVEAEVQEAHRAVETVGGRVKEIRDVNMPGLGGPRSLVVLEKLVATPAQYPRRPGIPAKRPL